MLQLIPAHCWRRQVKVGDLRNWKIEQAYGLEIDMFLRSLSAKAEEGKQMSNPAHLAIMGRGAAYWNHWRKENPKTRPDLSGATLGGVDLGRADLRGVDLRGADLRGADLNEADLSGANLVRASLQGVDLSEANLFMANLFEANLFEANLRGADLHGANLVKTDLRRANLRRADLSEANLLGTRLRGAISNVDTTWPDGFSPNEAGMILFDSEGKPVEDSD